MGSRCGELEDPGVAGSVASAMLDPCDAPTVGEDVRSAIPASEAADGHRPLAAKVAAIPEDAFALCGRFVLEAIDPAHSVPEKSDRAEALDVHS